MHHLVGMFKEVSTTMHGTENLKKKVLYVSFVGCKPV